MKIWLVTLGEPLPTDPGTPRLLRAGLLANLLAQAGHQVTWWTSVFDHFGKRHRPVEEGRSRVQPGLDLYFLRAPGYRRNLSLARIRDHRLLARRFVVLAPKESPPDVVLASFPSIELALEAARYGAKRGIPVVLDVRDLWPDIFLDHLPRLIRPLARPLLSPLFQDTREAFRLARAVTGITPLFVAWGLRAAGREAGSWDRDFPLAYPATPLAPDVVAEARAWWEREHGLTANNELTAVFFGSFGRQVDLDGVIDAARELSGSGIRFVLCGDGEALARCRRRAADLDHVIFPGWVDAPRIQALMQWANVGLAPYFSRPDFLMSYPNKVLEYLAFGLPVLSAMDGLVGGLLRENDCGEVYTSPADLAGRLLALRDDPGRRTAMSIRARGLFQQRFDAARVYADMGRYLESLV